MDFDIQAVHAEAAVARAEAIRTVVGEENVRAPLGVGLSRALPAPVVLRASLHTRSLCDCDDVDQSGNCVGCGSSEPPEWVRFCGVASVTGVGYEMYDMFGPYTEVVAPTAFDLSLGNYPDTVFLVNHTGMTMSRTVSNDLLLTGTPEGLMVTAWANYCRHDVHDFTLAVRNGHIDQMSFSAYLRNGEWNSNATIFTMTELDLNRGDVSAVNLGANPHTSIAARSHQLLDEIDRLPVGMARVAVRALQARLDQHDSDRWWSLPLTETAPPPRRPWTCPDLSRTAARV